MLLAVSVMPNRGQHSRKSAKSLPTRQVYRASDRLPHRRFSDAVDFVTSGITSPLAPGKTFVVLEAAHRRRNSDESLLYQVVAGELETFLASQQDNGRQVP